MGDCAIVCTLPLTPLLLSVILSEPARLPGRVGVNVTLIAQLAPGCTELPHVLVWAKSPLELMLSIFSTTLPGLLTCTLSGALARPTGSSAKETLTGNSAMTGRLR